VEIGSGGGERGEKEHKKPRGQQGKKNIDAGELQANRGPVRCSLKPCAPVGKKRKKRVNQQQLRGGEGGSGTNRYLKREGTKGRTGTGAEAGLTQSKVYLLRGALLPGTKKPEIIRLLTLEPPVSGEEVNP